MYCRECGKELTPFANFCKFCGSRVDHYNIPQKRKEIRKSKQKFDSIKWRYEFHLKYEYYNIPIERDDDSEIDFASLKNIFLNYGVIIEAVPNDFSKKMMTKSEANIINKRISDGKYLYSDVNYFILNTIKLNNFNF